MYLLLPFLLLLFSLLFFFNLFKKFYAWEERFIEKILGVRGKELVVVRNMALVRAWITFFMSCTPTITAMATFLAYSASGRAFNAGTIFSSLALMALLRLPLSNSFFFFEKIIFFLCELFHCFFF